MKKLVPLLMVFMLMCLFSFSQNKDTTAKTSTKPIPALLKNEIYAGYGAFSVFYFTGNFNHDNYIYSLAHSFSSPQSVGAFSFGYSRSLSRVVSVGLLFGYQALRFNGSVSLENSSGVGMTVYKITADDKLVTGMVGATFSYFNKPWFCLYSAIGVGLTVDFGKQDLPIYGKTIFDPKILPAGQLTVIGLRFGHQLGGFVEAGFGSLGILNAGLSYKFTKSIMHSRDTTLNNNSKKTQSVHYNDLYIGYGVPSFFYFTGNFSHFTGLVKFINLSDPRSAGNIFIGYSRSISRVVSAGLIVGYQHSQMTAGRNRYPFTGVARFTFCYYMKPLIQLYSRVGIGITMDFGTNLKTGKNNDLQLQPACEINLLGLRFGRALGGFIEAGFGSYGILNAGLSYKFAD